MMQRVKYEMVALYDKPCNMFNVGCMIPYMNYTPRTFEEIIHSEDKENGYAIPHSDYGSLSERSNGSINIRR